MTTISGPRRQSTLKTTELNNIRKSITTLNFKNK